jgi:glycosyltransferase involved in cell wall biosynthesis
MAERPLKILVACGNAGPWGGAQNAMLAEIEGLRRAGHQVRVLSNQISPQGQETGADYVFRNNSANTRHPGTFLRTIYNPRAYRAARAAIEDFRPDVIHVHLFVLQLSPAVFLAAQGLPVFATVHDCAMFCPIGNRYLRRKERVCGLRWGTACIGQGCITLLKLPHVMMRNWLLWGVRGRVNWLAPSTYMRHELLKAGFTGVTHLPYGFDTDKLGHLPLKRRERTNDIIFCSRLDYSKGTHVLLESVRQVRHRLPDVRLVVAGDGPELERLRRQALSMELSGCVDLIGWRSADQILKMHRTAGVMAAPFLGPDNFPLVICESMLLGTPVAATKVGGVPDLIEDRVTGRLVAPNDARQLAEAIVELFADQELRQRVTAEARTKALGLLAMDRHIAGLEKLYIKSLPAGFGASDRRPAVRGRKTRRILLVNDYGQPAGGAEIYTFGLKQALEARGHQVRLLSSDRMVHGKRPQSEYTFAGIDYTASLQRQTRGVFSEPARRAMLRALDDFKPDVVHLQMFLQQCTPSVLEELKGVPAVATIHEYGLFCPVNTKLILRSGRECRNEPGPACISNGCVTLAGLAAYLARRSMVRQLGGSVRRWLPPSRYAEQRLKAAGFSNLEWLPYGFEPDGLPWFPRNKRGPVSTVLFLGRIDLAKGIFVLLEAWPEVIKASPGARLAVVGNGPHRDQFLEKARRLGIAGSIDYRPWLSHRDIVKLHREAALLAAPSIWPDNLPLVICESMMMGTPVAAAGIGGIPDLISDGQTGRLVPPNDVGALARAIVFLIEDRESAGRMAENARTRAGEMLSMERHIGRLERIYDGL